MMHLVNIVKALVVRSALTLHALMAMWRVTVMYDDNMWWLMSISLLPMLLETLYTIIKRQGREFLWFTPCFFNYLLATVPCVWLLELDKSQSYIDGTEERYEIDAANNETAQNPTGLDLNPAMWNIIIEELLLYLLIVSRWILPRGKVTREQLSELLFAFIGIASDIMEMFSLFGERDVRIRMYMGYWILSVWSVSVLQFTMTVTVTHQPKKAKNIKVIEDLDEYHETKKMRREIFAIIVSMMMQDVPFVTLRLYTIVTYNIVTYSLVFFTAKNILVILLLIYKIITLIQKRYWPEEEEEEEEMEEEGRGYNGKGSRDRLVMARMGNGGGNRPAGDARKRNGRGVNNNGGQHQQGDRRPRQRPKKLNVAMAKPQSHDASRQEQEGGLSRNQREPTKRSMASSDGEFDSLNASPATARSTAGSDMSAGKSPIERGDAPLLNTTPASKGDSDNKRADDPPLAEPEEDFVPHVTVIEIP